MKFKLRTTTEYLVYLNLAWSLKIFTIKLKYCVNEGSNLDSLFCQR